MSNAIIRLADSQFSKEVEDFGGLSIDLKDALEELQTKQKKEAAQSAAQEVMKLLNEANCAIEDRVKMIQAARRQEASSKSRISEINKAKAYGLATNNFVPLGILVGMVYERSVENKDLLKIDESKLPEGWDKKPESK
jgi:hypothetical protein